MVHWWNAEDFLGMTLTPNRAKLLWPLTCHLRPIVHFTSANFEKFHPPSLWGPVSIKARSNHTEWHLWTWKQPLLLAGRSHWAKPRVKETTKWKPSVSSSRASVLRAGRENVMRVLWIPSASAVVKRMGLYESCILQNIRALTRKEVAMEGG